MPENLRSTQNVRVISILPLVPPKQVKEELPHSEEAIKTVLSGRDAVEAILQGHDNRLLVVVGPCSIHDERVALEYARKLRSLACQVQDKMFIVMRVYFEKPRTTIGWKGLIYDPYLNGTYDIAAGLRKARSIFLQLAEMGMPAGTEMLDPIVPQYIDDLVSWGSLGARTTESQTHRQMASGLSMPIGYKNATDGDVQIAIDAMHAAQHPHSFLGIDMMGQTCIFNTAGNPMGHLILRGGRMGPNYDAANVSRAIASMKKSGLRPNIMVDCSHGNSNKDFRRQGLVWKDVLAQREAGNNCIIGAMLESNLCEGNQRITAEPDQLIYGVSITDPCLGWEETQELLRKGYEVLGGASVGTAPV